MLRGRLLDRSSTSVGWCATGPKVSRGAARAGVSLSSRGYVGRHSAPSHRRRDAPPGASHAPSKATYGGSHTPSPLQGEHAVVLGASMSGILAARVLADYFDQVTVVERDRPPVEGQPRRGVPQARHAHILLARGGQIIDELFPGFGRELVEAGAPYAEGLDQLHLEVNGHVFFHDPDDERSRRPDVEGMLVQPSRPFLDAALLRRIRVTGARIGPPVTPLPSSARCRQTLSSVRPGAAGGRPHGWSPWGTRRLRRRSSWSASSTSRGGFASPRAAWTSSAACWWVAQFSPDSLRRLASDRRHHRRRTTVSTGRLLGSDRA